MCQYYIQWINIQLSGGFLSSKYIFLFHLYCKVSIKKNTYAFTTQNIEQKSFAINLELSDKPSDSESYNYADVY